jgi:hypothetical protein
MSTVQNPYVIPHIMSDPNPGQAAIDRGINRTLYQNNLNNVSKGGIASGGTSSKSKMKKSKKMRMSKRMSRMSSRRRFSRKFRKSLSKLRISSRKSVLGKRRNKHKNKKNKKFIIGGEGATMTIPSFSQTSPNGTAIINQLSVAHSQGLANAKFDSDVNTTPTNVS